jgi:hypothetical protein
VALTILVLSMSATLTAAPPEHADVRVLIDISGSMRQNDPDNLRRPALRMLAGLLQPGSRAGVWTFARWVNNLVPVADVDEAWKTRTLSVSEQITSPGQFTNIEEVLEQAAADWTGEPTTHARHLVLLTDGMVDVSKEAGANDASRERILEQLLPRLEEAEVKVHTIALSARADHELMRRLAERTGGWYQQVDQADELQRVFLRMFEQVGRPDTVPLEDNRFTVDSSVTEATVLLFTKPDSPRVVLRSPAGDSFTDSDLPGGVAWYRDQGYHLITIAQPRKGEWSVEADIDPDNRVMIVTDLKLRASELPAHIAIGEPVHVEAHLTNRGELVTRQAFLRLLDLRADAIGPDGRDPQPINDAGQSGDRQADDGRYAFELVERRALPQVELRLAVDSPTFVREKRFRFAVHEPLSAVAAESPDGPEVLAEVQPAVLQPGAELRAWHLDAQGGEVALALDQYRPGQYRAHLPDSRTPAYVAVSGTTRLGNLVERTYGPLTVPGAPAVSAPAVVPEPEPVAAPREPAAPPAPAAEPPAEPAPPVEAEESGGDWLVAAAVFGGFNLLLAIAGGAWWWLRRRRRGDEGLEIDEPADLAGGDRDKVEDAA